MAEHSRHDFRTSLPAKMPPRNEVSVWGLLKNCIGKDLSKITMPVVLNEPLSFLQRLSEYMEYSFLLTEAAKQEDPVDRMKYVAAFAVSALASNWERLGKPFNPLLGETYELIRNDYKVICEQVSHHPPISAFHAESPDFKFHGSINPKLKFWGKSVEIEPCGTVTVELPKWNEAYSWSNVNCCVHNILVGKLWIEQYGLMEILNHSTKLKATLNFKAAGWNPKNLHRVEGFIEDKKGQKIYFLYGKWTEFLKCSSSESYEEYCHMKKLSDKDAKVSPESTPKKVLSKLHSFKISSFRSLSIQDNDNIVPPEINEMPRSETAYSLEIPGSVELWKCYKRPDNSQEYYQFSNFAMTLNQMESYMSTPGILCPTDSRLRPDIRCLEEGDVNGASLEKLRLEEKQRNTRKQKKLENGALWKPRWFESSISPQTEKKGWLYIGGYWDRNFSDIDDIF